MMPENPNKTIHINLSDYAYHRDVAHRLVIAELTAFEVDVIQEILHSSLKIATFELANALSVNESILIPVLEKLQNTELFYLEKGHMVVDKYMRKFYEFQIAKFDNNFRADMEFLRKFLQQIPIHLLPTWYSIPRTSDDIFSSIIERFFLTPKIYQQHLDNLTFDDPCVRDILNDIYDAPDFKVRSKTLIEKYSLSRETFEEYMLLLEFNLACCLSYNQRDGYWEEVVTPFFEWHTYRRFLRDKTPKPIQQPLSIQRTHPQDFGFIQDMATLVTAISNQPLPLKNDEENDTLPPKTIHSLLSSVHAEPLSDHYLDSLIVKLQQFQLATKVDHHLCPSEMADSWLKKHHKEQALAMYSLTRISQKTSKRVENDVAPSPFSNTRKYDQADKARAFEDEGGIAGYSSFPKISEKGGFTPVLDGYVDKNQREIEKCLKIISIDTWIYFEDFVNVCTAPIASHSPVTLQKTGKRWKYQLPKYTPEDIETLKNYLFQNLFYAGIIATGVHAEKPCFCITPFGRTVLN